MPFVPNIRPWVRRHASFIADSAEMVSAYRLADRADRLRCAGDMEAIALPARATRGRTRRIKMLGHDGRDLIVAALREGWQRFEPPLLDVFLAVVRAGRGHVLDVGANTGLYSLLAAAVGAQHVHAFEPYPPVLELLQANLALNRCAKHIDVQPLALADEQGEAALYIPPPSPNNPVESSASLAPDFKETIAEQVTVRLNTLDRYWDTAGRPPVSVVKIDVESREYPVLRGGRRMIDTTRPVILYELLPAGDAAGIQAFADELDLVDAYARPQSVVVGQPIEHQPDAWNHLLTPREKLESTLALLRDIDLTVEQATAC